MLTKAGVPAHQIMVGLTSYGRTFHMTTPGCTGPMCTYDAAGAAGRCTQTEGYLAQAEINEIIATNPTAQLLIDSSSNTNILIYNQTEWVGYIDAGNQWDRGALYQYIGFGGTSEWAIDLEAFGEDDSSSGSDPNQVVFVPPSIWDSSNPAVACVPPCTLVLPPYQLGFTTTLNWPPLTTSVASLSGTVTVTVTTTIVVPPLTTTEIEWWPITIGNTQSNLIAFSAVQSVMPPPFTYPFSAGVAPFPPSQIPQTGGSTTSSSVGAAAFVIPATNRPVAIQPQPTVSMQTPPPKNIPSVTWTAGPPQATCTSGCGTLQCSFFGCGESCGLFACNGGCGIWGCGGGCGLFGCGGPTCSSDLCDGGCPLTKCGGSGCVGGACGELGCPSGDCTKCPPEGCGGLNTDPSEDCTELQTATICTLVVSSFVPAGTTAWSTTTQVKWHKSHIPYFPSCPSTPSRHSSNRNHTNKHSFSLPPLDTL